ncbi:6,7-dimethyl-8-ribityllumazine synthase [Treponema sp. J25]|uniref:6,7-dimethyl-8-ribityllumazine synthase n=1 Tax=Treponema sp. J25 TaxID=2094121 RepID=UPI00104CC24B|nr:6,7-dimethyl-8-ribityllumazine synthase [Treponema sp. J25]TCW60879.1 6,7-dimethyl-8-ribityllumazine synthase [Treponema sp. J25]
MDITIIEGSLIARQMRLAIVASRFNDFIVSRLIEGALDGLLRHGAEKEKIRLVRVPGAFEIPLAAQILARDPTIDGILCLGALIRGSTPHFDYVAAEVSKGIAQVGLATGKPVIFSVLTTDSIEQAVERAGTKAGNKGFEGACALIEMVNLCRSLGEGPACEPGLST